MNQEASARIREKLERELGPAVMTALKDPEVIEILLNPDGRIWVERLGVAMAVAGEMPASNAEAVLATVAASLGSVVTRQNPIVEGELLVQGCRFEGVLPPLVAAPTFSIRKKASRVFSLAEYVERGIATAAQAAALRAAVAERENILVVGGTGSGKTTLLNAVIGEISIIHPEHRVVVIEDTVELQCRSENVVALHTSDEISMQRLLRVTMRLRPDRILVGEVRGAEALALLKAWNTGHPGGLATIHANGAAAGLTRLAQLIEEGLSGGRADPAVIAEAIDLVVFIEKGGPAGRQIAEMAAVLGHGPGGYQFKPIGTAPP